jgi:predicted AAA+ superfamily ATPase
MNENRQVSYIPRAADSLVLAFLGDGSPHKNVLMVEGARQVGKSSLVAQALGKCSCKATRLNLERDSRVCSEIDECRDFQEFDELLRDRLGFRSDAGEVLFVDEAQESRRLGGFVRFMKEEWPRASVILSGSTLGRIFREGMRYPVGRVARIVLGPFSFSEFLEAIGEGDLAGVVRSDSLEISPQRHRRLLELYNSYLRIGGLPAVVLAWAGRRDWSGILSQILADYERDFVRIFGEADVALVKGCLRSVANFVGGVSKNTSVWPNPTTRMNARIAEVFSRLEDWHLILRSDQKGPGPEATHAYLPKRYLFDTGMLRHLREAAVPDIDILETVDSNARKALGGVLENQVAIDLARQGLGLNGWKKTPSGGEIDFIVKLGDRAIPIECKAALKSDRRQWQGVVEYLGQYGQSHGVVAGLAPWGGNLLASGMSVWNVPGYLMERLGRFTPLAEG